MGILRPRGRGMSAADGEEIIVFHWFYNVSASAPMIFPMCEGHVDTELGRDADDGNRGNALFYNVFERFPVNHQKMHTMEILSTVAPFVKCFVLQRFPKVPSLRSGPDSHRLHLLPKGMEL